MNPIDNLPKCGIYFMHTLFVLVRDIIRFIFTSNFVTIENTEHDKVLVAFVLVSTV